jgi:hypothetical protein
MTDFDEWLAGLEARHLADLRFSEVSRALRALSATYVGRRGKLGRGSVLAGAGKRAAFALFYGPLHYMLVREIVGALPGAAAVRFPLVDLGCGTGAAGAAWASVSRECPTLLGIDRHPWALAEAGRTYRTFHLDGRTRLANLASPPLPGGRAVFLAAFALNELGGADRDTLLSRLLERAAGGDPVLVVEPLAGFVAPWWGTWRRRFEAAGGRADEWRFRLELPAIVMKLDRAAGLNHRELTGRSLWIGHRSG